MKNILVIHYSQSGQLTEIVNNIVSPIKKSNQDVNITYHKLEMEKPYSFPWNNKDFFGVFPETFLQIPEKIQPIPTDVLNQDYDLVILGYQIWYLTPSLPINSFLESTEASKLLKNKPVITVIGCRNMWIKAQEKMKQKLNKLEANLVGNIVLADRHINHISVITISYWMMSGKKDRMWNLFPKPGVSQDDIDSASKFGPIILKHLSEPNFNNLQEDLLKEDAVRINSFLVTVDKRANLIFSKWANLIKSKSEKGTSKRHFWAKVFNYYLLFAIWILSPIVFVLFLLTYAININQIKKDKMYYSSVKMK